MTAAANTPNGAVPPPYITSAPLAEALQRLARGAPNAFAGLLHDVESEAVVDGTKVTAHCHCLKLDGNGRPRVQELVQFVADLVLEYAIPRKEIRDAEKDLATTRSPQKIVRLQKQAEALFTDLAKSGEGGELLLFALAERLLRLPQLICKMSLKTNTRMHIHGADGLHVGADPKTGKLLLYWGESKIYHDVTRAIHDCLSSVGPMLSAYYPGQRDLQLLQRHADLDDEALETAFKKFLDPHSEEFNSLEFRGLCLVGFDCEAYPKEPCATDVAAIAQEIARTLPGWKDHIRKYLAEEELNAFAMHFLFVPFPSAEDFRQRLREELGIGPMSARSVPTSTSQPAAAAKPTRGRRRSPASQATPERPPATKPKEPPNGAA